MNDHEIERIADAMHHLRPDWPTKQLRTLLGSPGLVTRPRRDVTVALAWVACESGTANPYRVLEAGPWWRAAAVDELATAGPDKTTPDQRCGICGKRRDRCENAPRFGDDDHRFEPDFKQRTGSAVDELRDIKASAMGVTESSTSTEETSK